MAESRTASPEVTVTAGAESFHVSGRAAALIALMAVHAERINALPVGKLIAHIAQGQVKLELRESLPAVRLER